MANTTNATILSLLGILVCLKGVPVTASTCLKLGYDDAYEIFTNILCLHGAAVSVIPTQSGVSWTVRVERYIYHCGLIWSYNVCVWL